MARRKSSPSATPGQAWSPSGDAASSGNGPRVLVADDDPHIREVIRFALERSSFEVEEAADGRQALERFHVRVPDLLVLDILMPELDGTEVCRRLRAGDPEHRRVPIIFLS
ncbi:MAG: response regulator, partial [Holophagales bacterium]|nr:response regulator [Holophagales bacterium]